MPNVVPFTVISLDIKPLSGGLVDRVIGRTLKYTLDQHNLDDPNSYTVLMVMHPGDRPYDLIDERRWPKPKAIHMMSAVSAGRIDEPQEVIVLEIDPTV